MMNNQEEPRDVRNTRENERLVLYLKLLREAFGETELPQADLADILGIAPEQLDDYESLREVPEIVVHLIGAAYVLGTQTVENLIAPNVLEEILSRLDERLEARGLPTPRPSDIGFRPHEAA